MHIPLTRYGLPQVVIFPVLICTLMVVLFVVFRPAFWLIPAEAILFLVLIWMLSFFRDPLRTVIPDEMILYSPADATITDIDEMEHDELGKTLRIGMFLSIFNVHVNRMPCSVRIEKVTYKRGKFLNAMSPEAYKANEANDTLVTGSRNQKTGFWSGRSQAP